MCQLHSQSFVQIKKKTTSVSQKLGFFNAQLSALGSKTTKRVASNEEVIVQGTTNKKKRKANSAASKKSLNIHKIFDLGTIFRVNYYIIIKNVHKKK